MKKFNKEQLETLKALWKEYTDMEDLLYMKINELEEIGKANLDINIEFFRNDEGCLCGIGDMGRKYELVQREKLEESTLETPRGVVKEDL